MIRGALDWRDIPFVLATAIQAATPSASPPRRTNGAATSASSELHFLGKVADGGNSPTLHASSEIMHGREVYILQGWKITDTQTSASLKLPSDEAVIAVPKALMRYLPGENHGAAD